MPSYQSAVKKQAGAGCTPTGPWALLTRPEGVEGGGGMPYPEPSSRHFSISMPLSDMCARSVGPLVPLAAKDTDF